MKWKSSKKDTGTDGASNATVESKKKEEAKGPPMSNYWRILSFGTRTEHLFLLVALGSAVASGVPLPLMNIIFGNLAGDFNNYFIPGGGVSESRFKSSINRNALYIVYLFIAKFVLTYVGMFCFRTVGLRISAAMRLGYLEALFHQPVRKLDEVSVGTVANTVTTAANTIQLSISDRLHVLFMSLAVVIAAYAIAFAHSWALTLVTSSGILFIIVFYSVHSPFTLKVMQQVEKAEETHATVAAEAISSIRTVYALGAESKLIDRHTRCVDEAHKCGMRLSPHIALQLTPLFFAIYACFALAFWYGLKLYQDGHIADVGAVIIVFFSVLLVTAVLGQIFQPWIFIAKAVSVSGNFFDMIDAQRVSSAGISGSEVSVHGDIQLKDVNFAYPTRPGVQVLKNFNATFQAGKTTALVGPSGSGKSTIVALLERWYELRNDPTTQTTVTTTTTTEKGETVDKQADPDDNQPSDDARERVSGSIITDGHDISDFNVKWWRSQIGLVQQEPFLFNDTIENNVAYGLTGTEWENSESAKKLELVKDACKEAFADEFISKLPKGYSTVVGESGIKLSGGQRQRIAIARSIIRKPAILILDEATSAIDVQGERIVQEALDRISKNRTTIVIAHRLSTIRKADHIIVLRNGTKIEEGTHDELLSINEGLYKGLVQAQALEKDDRALEDSTLPIEQTLSRQASAPGRVDTLQSIDGVQKDDMAMEEGMAGQYPTKGFFKTVGLLLYENRSHWLLYGIVVIGAMGAGSAYALQSWFFAHLVNAFTFVGQRLRDAQNFWALMFFILALAVGLFYAMIGWAAGVISCYTGTTCKKDYFRSALKMPIPYYDRQDNSSGTVMSLMSGDPKQLSELLGLNGAFPLISVFNVIGCAIVSFYFGWKLTLVTLFGVMPVVMAGSFFRLRYEVQFETMNAKVFADSSQFATEAIGAFRTVSSLTMEDSIINKYRALLREQIYKSTRKSSYAMLLYAFTDSVELCGMALTFWYGGQLLASREYEPMQFFVIFAAIVQGAQAAGQYLSISPNIAKATAAANRILQLRAEAKLNSEGLSQNEMPTRNGFGAKIEFEDVSFHYATNPAPLFSHLNISIEPGQFVAFVGPSGCGKTTTISLLERFYQPSMGRITFDDVDINNIGTASYRRELALVSQEPRLFSGTIRQNLLIGVDESSVTEEEIFQVCRDAEIHDFITSLPESYETELGLNAQTALSGGQKQRLCLARALLRKPKLLVLDEATSSLDSQSERLVQGAIERLAGQRSMTVIAVAHRLATIQKADVIFVFGERDVDGRRGSKIAEKGTHQSLLARKGIYWTMCQAQALDA